MGLQQGYAALPSCWTQPQALQINVNIHPIPGQPSALHGRLGLWSLGMAWKREESQLDNWELCFSGCLLPRRSRMWGMVCGRS